jgi:4-hydroxy-3-methylbut-2-enyl diphosphate reductase
LNCLPVRVVNATCPRVAWIQRLVQKQALAGRHIIIWGSAGHPEVEGLLGYALGRGAAVGSAEEIEALPDFEEVFLAAQTTQDHEQWPTIEQAVLRRWPRAVCRKTICQAAVSRQRETVRLSREVDCLVVAGGRDSGNTQRLAGIGRRAGLPVLTVEGPEEIEASQVEGLAKIGLAAGASTPIWQIRAIVQKLEALGRRRENSLPSFFRRLLRALVLSHFYAGIGAGCLGLALARWAGYQMPDIFFGLYFFHVQAMHLLNGYLDRESSRYNDPDRAVFLRQYRSPLLAAGIASLLLSLSAGWLSGPWVLGQLLVQGGLGLAYALPWPRAFFGIRRLKDLPLSKTLSITIGWTALLVGPLILSEPPLIARTAAGLKLAAVLGGAVFLNVLSRTMLLDLQDAYSDRLFGQSTLATVLGKKKAGILLGAILVLWAVYLPAAGQFLGGPRFQWWLAVCGPLYSALILLRFLRSPGLSGFQFDLLADGQFLLFGLAALCLGFLS